MWKIFLYELSYRQIDNLCTEERMHGVEKYIFRTRHSGPTAGQFSLNLLADYYMKSFFL